MSIPTHRSCQILQAILRPRTAIQIQHPFFGRPISRTLSLSCRYASSSYSVSFGPETDEMIESYTSSAKKNPRSSDKAKRSKSRAQSSTRTVASTGSIEITLNDEDGDILATKQTDSIADSISDQLASASAVAFSTESAVSTESDGAFDAARSQRKRKPKRIPPESRGDSDKTTVASSVQRKPVVRTERWQVQKDALSRKLRDANWNPRKKLSPDAIQGLRDLHAEDPERYSTPVLADRFKVSPEAIRRILKSKWRATPEVMDDRRQRWARRHDRIWDHKAALGQRPPREQARTPEGPEAFEEELRAKQMLGQI